MFHHVILLLALLGLSVASNAHDMNPHGHSPHQKRGGLAVALAADAADARGGLWRAEARDGHLWVSQSADEGVTFSAPVKVNATPETILAEGQNRPQIAVLTAGGQRIVAVAWAQALDKVFSGRVRFSRSLDGGRSFEPPRTINDDQGKADAIGHSFVAMDALGTRLTLAWIDGRAAHAARTAAGGKKNAYAGSAIYVAQSGDAGASFSANRTFVDHSCECCQLALTHTPEGAPLLLWRHLFEGMYRDFAIARIADAGATVIERASHDRWAINACPHHGGALAVAADGTRHWLWFTGAAEHSGLFYRQQKGGVLSAPQPVGNPDAQAGYPALWAGPAIGQTPGQTTSPAPAPALHRVWREFEQGSYVLKSQRSQDGGMSWSDVRSIATSHGAADQPLFVHDASRPLLAWRTKDEGLRVFDLQAQP